MRLNPDNWSLSLVEPPGVEPITADQAKSHLRIDFTDDDDYINGLILVARTVVESQTNRALITQTWDYTIEEFPKVDEIKIRKANLISVSSVNYTDSAGVENIMSTDDYVVDTKSVPGRIFLKFSRVWPPVILQPSAAVRINFTAGYGDTPETIPQPIIQAMYLLISHYYEQREPVILTSRPQLAEVPMSVKYLLAPYKVVMLQ